jgi:hypothetical protein
MHVCLDPKQAGVIGGVAVLHLIRSSAARLDGEAKLFLSRFCSFISSLSR